MAVSPTQTVVFEGPPVMAMVEQQLLNVILTESDTAGQGPAGSSVVKVSETKSAPISFAPAV